MLCARFLRAEHSQSHGRGYRAIEDVYQKSLDLYMRSLHWVMDHRRVAMVFSLGILIGTCAPLPFRTQRIHPERGHRPIIASTESIEGTTFDAMVPLSAPSSRSSPGSRGRRVHVECCRPEGVSPETNQGRLIIRLKERSERDATADQVIRDSSPRCPRSRASGSSSTIAGHQRGGRFSKSQYQYTLQGRDLEELYIASNDRSERLQDARSSRTSRADLQISNRR
jgi:multidrug efflux pump subunit AcrB